MSFTVWYTKPDGRQVPIKMSIWDAMKGVPDPKPRKPKTCSCCGKAHVKDRGKEDSKCEDKKDAKDTDNNGKSGNADTPSKDKKDDSELTEDDRTLLRMKGENPQAQWKEILAVTTNFKNVGELKARWKHISHRPEADDKNTSSEGKKETAPDKEEKAKRNREEGLRRKAEKEAAKAKKEEEEKKAEEQKQDSTESDKKDDDTKADEKAKKPGSSPHSLKAWADNYDKKKWQILASKHYDRTGERITAAQARKLAEEK
ncbi:hypothetical protein AYO20_11600 [Fonsecaea nubica]|uniref:Myb-like domain-containing protein n=1 Tax=Fonsecaea nubica TaxID=856822 RepID=A0A178BRR8_9EURO|nr:hypothetical protein AYO20_11600 [Fonsecaea nubica]OAL19696.1 hypothetical protein AYO20_11600 [Fonsecaea nubica]